MIDDLKANDKPNERAFMAAVLGELYTARRPDHLAEMVNGSNYTWRDNPRIDIHRLANEFLFDYLIPAFGDEWR